MSERRPDKFHLSTHQEMVHQVAKVMPESLRQLLTGRGRWRYLRKGAVYPDSKLRDFHNHYVDVETNRYGAVEFLTKRIEHMRQFVNEHRVNGLMYKNLAFHFGVLSHYITDLGQPLHTGSTPAERRIHSVMEREVADRVREMPFILEPKSVGVVFPKYLIDYCVKTHMLYYDIMRGYTDGNGLPACMGAVKEAYNSSCNATADIFLHCWRYGWTI